MKYRAIQKFQVFDRGDGPRWLEIGEPVPTHYMSPGQVARFLQQGRMEIIEEEVLEVEVAEAPDAGAAIVAQFGISAKEGFNDEELEALRRSSSVEEMED